MGLGLRARARVSADFRNRTTLRFARGAVLRSFAGTEYPTDATYAAFSLPNQNSYADRFVAFEAFKVAGHAEPALRARVYFCEALTPDGSFDDADGRCTQQPPAAPRITTWQVGR